MIERICKNCQKSFEAHLSEVRRGDARFCSRSCAMIFNQRDGGWHRKTGTMKHKGYVLEWAPKHPASIKGYVPQHRLIIERSIGRILTDDEAVHHINRKRDDNRIENLQLMTRLAHMELHRIEDLTIFVHVNGAQLSWSKACKAVGIDRSTARSRRLKFNLSHQEVIDYYIKHGRWHYIDGRRQRSL